MGRVRAANSPGVDTPASNTGVTDKFHIHTWNKRSGWREWRYVKAVFDKPVSPESLSYTYTYTYTYTYNLPSREHDREGDRSRIMESVPQILLNFAPFHADPGFPGCFLLPVSPHIENGKQSPCDSRTVRPPTRCHYMPCYLSESRRALDVALNDWQAAGLLKPAVARLERPVTAGKTIFCDVLVR